MNNLERIAAGPATDKTTGVGSGRKTTQLLLVTICILLGGILITNLWYIRQDMQGRRREVFQQTQAAQIREALAVQDELIFGLLDDYQASAYGSSVDRIAEQQLIAAETQIVALQTIALQNRQITELLLLGYQEPSDVPAGEERILGNE